MRFQFQGRGARVLRALGVLLVWHACFAWAAPEDDFRAGSQAYRTGDVVQAMALLKRSADAGHAPSQSLLAYILDKAEFDEDAVAYYRKAAAQGDAEGEFGLGSMYAAGEGVKRDRAEARKWITRAAEKGHEWKEKRATAEHLDHAVGKVRANDSAIVPHHGLAGKVAVEGWVVRVI